MVKASTATLAQSEFLLVALDELRPSPTNPRKFIDQKSLQELTDSIRSKGILVPLIVRPVSGNQPYEIVAGERRYRAAQAAELCEIPVRILEMTDEEVLEAQQIENLQREDVHPLDEADGYGRLIDAGFPAHMIALKLGKPVDYITRRLKLRSLVEFSRQAFSEKLITVDHALLLSKLGSVEQEEALRYTLDRGAGVKTKTEQILIDSRERAKETGEFSYWEPVSVLELKQHIENALELELKKAPWDLADADLVESAGACTTCPSNTAANTALFGDLAIEKATCTDSACFNAKRQAFVTLQIEAVADAGKASVKISHKHSSTKPKFLKDGSGPDLSTTFKRGQWVEAKKGECDNVITGVTVDFGDTYGGTAKPGVKKSVCVAAKCKAHRKDYEASSSSKGSSRSTYDPKAEKEKREKREAAAKEEAVIRVGNTIEAVKHVKKLTPEILRAAAIELTGYGDDSLKNIVGAGIKSKLETIDTGSVEFARILVGLLVKGMLDVNAWDDNHTPERTRLFSTLKRLTGYDAAAAFKKAAPEKKAKTRK
jgi:ParB/RepB/Spo0J family partition protein